MNPDEITKQILKHSSEIAGIKEKLASAHKRIDEIGIITDSIHKLAASVESMSVQVANLAQNMDGGFERLEDNLKDHDSRLGVLEKEPGIRWKSLISQLISLIVAAVIGGITSKFI